MQAHSSSSSTLRLPATARAHAADAINSGAGMHPAMDSQHLLRGHKLITIHHNGAQYRLQTTRQGKLILTK